MPLLTEEVDCTALNNAVKRYLLMPISMTIITIMMITVFVILLCFLLLTLLIKCCFTVEETEKEVEINSNIQKFINCLIF